MRDAPAGEPTVKVVFDLDNENVLTVAVTAADLDTGAAVEASIHVQTSFPAPNSAR